MQGGIEHEFLSRSAPGDKHTSRQLCPEDTVTPSRDHSLRAPEKAPRDHMLLSKAQRP